MGRSKITIRRLESAPARQNTYSKRKNGITNKAEELSILCDVDVLLLMFSPGGKPTLITGAHSCWANIEKVNDMVRLCEMEESAVKSLDRLQKTKEEIFTQALHFGLAGGSSSTGHIFPVAQRDVGCSMHPIQPSEKVGSGLHFNPEYPCHHGNSMHGPYRNIGVPSCPIQHHEPRSSSSEPLATSLLEKH
ncbi:Floral homeotic protein GLOBOSA [Cinnamomum micranthum f. kanehirae]|uniref:Floral homeotic protein GLOBOSA n=1 Tax=Cinnamomum micranthum f. kanehirae TaxID=337451 RepID=A0A3S3PWJ6_9MAGN|nr:Floral homeotic protein GLOBOSA [Cinnamomum micranthum f. kanehirae]